MERQRDGFTASDDATDGLRDVNSYSISLPPSELQRENIPLRYFTQRLHTLNSADLLSPFIKHGEDSLGSDDDINAQILGGGGRTLKPEDPSIGRGRQAPLRINTITERSVMVTLEELYKGIHKSLKVTRNKYDHTTVNSKLEEKILEFDIRPGCRPGTKIKFKGCGDETESTIPDLHLIVTEVSISACKHNFINNWSSSQKAHPIFKCEGHNLRTTIEIDLKEALVGWRKKVSTIDGRQISISSLGPTHPGYESTYPGLGMPKSKHPSARGDMIVGINVVFPSSLTDAQRANFERML